MPACFRWAVCDLTHLCQVLLNYLSILLTKKCDFLTYPLSSAVLPFPLPFLALFHIWWLGPGVVVKVFLPLPHLPIQSWLVYTLQEEEGRQWKRASPAILPLHSWKYFAHSGAHLKAGHSKSSAHIIGSISSVCDLLSGTRECSVYLL